MGAITMPVREKLDNLIFVINCNLQRLDGPVRGNGKIIQELEAAFRGAGWAVIKVLWGSRWDPLLAHDHDGFLRRRMEEAVDGEYQNFKAGGGAYTREHFFGKYPELKDMVANMSDEEVWRLNRGGLDAIKVYAAYDRAMKQDGRPVVILAKTVKGYGMGEAGEGQMTAHQAKKLDVEDLKAFRDRFNIPISDSDIEGVPYYRPSADSEEIRYLQERRKQLGGYLPARKAQSQPLHGPGARRVPGPARGHRRPDGVHHDGLRPHPDDASCGIPNIGKNVVPIVPDEARTFGMEGMFRQIGIYSSVGQLYTPQDAEQLMYYREDKQGQILEEGINEAGAFCSWLAAATSYANHGVYMIPFYIFYSMFGFQRIGDFIWAGGDMQAKGFLLGATAGRTTLAGEGLQHQDGHSHLAASTIPNCVAYDPAFGYELAVIIQDGLRRMYEKQERIFYYITVMNENYPQPAMPEGVKDGILHGMYRLSTGGRGKVRVQLLGAGTILREVIAAAEILEKDYQVPADVWSVTSFSELRRDGLDCERWNLLHPDQAPRKSYVDAASPRSAARSLPPPTTCASSPTRSGPGSPAATRCSAPMATAAATPGRHLREFFEVDRKYIVVAALKALADEGSLDPTTVAEAIEDPRHRSVQSRILLPFNPHVI